MTGGRAHAAGAPDDGDTAIADSRLCRMTPSASTPMIQPTVAGLTPTNDSGKRLLANKEIQTYLDLEPNGQFADEAKALLKR